MYSICEKKNCESCDSVQNERNVRFLPVIESIFDIRDIQSSIMPITTTNYKCNQCGSTLRKLRVPNKIIIVDVDNPVPHVEEIKKIERDKKKHEEKKIEEKTEEIEESEDEGEVQGPMHTPLPLFSIDDIAKTICVEGENFTLHAILRYDENIKHFYAKIRRPNGKWELYDDLNRTARTAKTDELDSIQALFFVSGN